MGYKAHLAIVSEDGVEVNVKTVTLYSDYKFGDIIKVLIEGRLHYYKVLAVTRLVVKEIDEPVPDKSALATFLY